MKIVYLPTDPANLETSAINLTLSALKYQLEIVEFAEDLAAYAEFNPNLFLIEHPVRDETTARLISQIRGENINIPVIVISSVFCVSEEQAQWFHAGADDVVVGQQDAVLLDARIKAAVRRSSRYSEGLLTCGPITYDQGSQAVTLFGESVHLTVTETTMLRTLLLAKGRTVSKEMFLDALYGGQDEPDIKIIDVFICKIRRKFERLGGDQYIQTNWGRGYFLTANPASTVKPREQHRMLLLGALVDAPNQWLTSYEIYNKVSIGERHAVYSGLSLLHKKGFVRRSAAAGGNRDPLSWQITEAGRNHLKQTKEAA